MSVSEMFAALQAALGQDQDIREVPSGAGRCGAGLCGAVRCRAVPCGARRGGAWADGALCPQEIRKVVQALEQTAREMLTLLQGVHQGPGFQHSEFHAAAPGQRRTAAGRERRRSTQVPCPGPLFQVPASPGAFSLGFPKLLRRGQWEVSSQTSSKASVQHYGHRSVTFSPP